VDGDLEPTHSALLPLACTLGPDDGRSRMLRWRRLHDAADPIARLEAGQLEVRYQPSPGVLEELTDLAAAEQTCCSFAVWRASEVDGQPVLHVVSPTGAPEAVLPIAALFGATSTT